ncbi:MAG: hypothetical protein ACI9MR_004513, partial [Myxococcota bacterium]
MRDGNVRWMVACAVLAVASLGMAGCDDDGSKAIVDTDSDADTTGDTSEDTTEDTVSPDPLDLTVPAAAGESRAGFITRAEELIGGLKAEGQLGDVKIYNAQASFLIEGDRRTGGYRNWGGHVVDMDVARGAGEPGHDNFGDFLVTWNVKIFKPASFEVISDGTDGQAHVQVVGELVAYPFADSFLGEFLPLPEEASLAVTYDYRLGADD